MTFKDLFEDIENWFWKLEYNPEDGLYELYLGIPSDWIYTQNGDGPVKIELVHDLDKNVVIKISATQEDITVDDIILVGKALVNKNQELEYKKEQHRSEMERLKNELIEKEKSFLYYIDTVKEVNVPTKEEEEAAEEETEEEEESEGVNDGVTEGVKPATIGDFMKDFQKTHG